MSETTPLLPPRVQNALPSRSQIESLLPSDTRLHLARILGALSASKSPSQAQLSSLIDIALESDILKPSGGVNSKTARLGEEGSRVVESTKEVLRQVKKWGEEKNGDDIVQNLVWETTHAGVEVDLDVDGPSSKTSLRELSSDTTTLLSSLTRLLSTFIFSASPSSGVHVLDPFVLLSRDLLSSGLESAAEGLKDAAGEVAPSEKEKEEGKVDWEKAKDKGIEHARHTATGLYQAQAKEKAIDKAVDAKHWADENIPPAEEIKEKFLKNLQSIVSQAKSSPEYKQSLDTLLNLLKKYISKAQASAIEVKENVQKKVDEGVVEETDEEGLIRQAAEDAKTFVERIGGKSLDPLLEAGKKAATHIQEDPKLNDYWGDVSSYLDRIVNDEDYVLSQSAYRKASSLFDDGQAILKENDQWKSDADNLQKEIDSFLTAVTKDATTRDLIDAVERLGEDLKDAGTVGLGSLKLGGKGLYRDFTDIIIPRLVGLIKEIPVPRVEFKSRDVDLVIDDLKLESTNFIPDAIRLVQHNDFLFSSGYAAYASEYDGLARLKVKGLHFAASNIAYWVHKKSGYFQFEDSGLLDFEFGPQGIDFDVTLENASDKDRESFFTVKSVKVNITGFDYQIRENQHWFASWASRPAIRQLLLTQLSSTLEAQIAESLRNADFKLFALQQRTIAATNAMPTPANYLKAIFSDNVFGSSSSSAKPDKTRPLGFQKVGPRGAFLLSVGMDEDLFPVKPEGSARNKNRAAMQAKANQAKKAAKQKGTTVAGAVRNDVESARREAESEGRTLSRAAREQKRRENRTEGWRSDVFDL